MISLRDFKSFSPDIIHETYYSAIYPYGKKAKRVITIHDLIDFEFANSFPIHNFNKHWKSKAIFEADHVICVSNYTKFKLLQHFNIPEEKISVIHHGVDKISSSFNLLNIDEEVPFLLYVGQRWGYKNFKLFIDAFSKSLFLKSNFKIVCFGGGEFTRNELIFFSSKKINIEQVSGDDDVLNNLYKKAASFVYPSLSEGFGYPILEALNNNCVVIASNKGSIPEILGEHGIYFDPFDIDSIINVLESSLSNPSYLLNSLNLTSKRCQLFTIQKSVSETQNCYKKII
jgi:glycosyltransferase involved in cell wall biosynthesis